MLNVLTAYFYRRQNSVALTHLSKNTTSAFLHESSLNPYLKKIRHIYRSVSNTKNRHLPFSFPTVSCLPNGYGDYRGFSDMRLSSTFVHTKLCHKMYSDNHSTIILHCFAAQK